MVVITAPAHLIHRFGLSVVSPTTITNSAWCATMGNEMRDVPDSCFLLLEDGTVLTGKPFGARKQTNGEVGELFTENQACF